MASLSRRWTPDHARSLRGGGRHRHRLQTGRSSCHSPKSLHRRGADTAHGVVQRRPDGIHSAQGCPRGSVPQGQRRHLAKPASHRSQPGLQSTRCYWFAGCRDCFTEHQRVRQCSAGHSETWSCAGRGCRIHPALEAFDGLHPGTDGRHPRRQADRHLGQADRHVPCDSGHR